MPAVQTTYNVRMRAGLPGQVRNMETANTISRTVEEAAGLPFGVPAVQGVNGVIAVGSSSYSAVAAAVAGNTGNGAIGAVSVGPGVKRGVYTLELIGAAANAGTFQVTDPEGKELPTLKVGVAYTGPIGLTIADGSTDWAVGDQVTVTVSATAGGVYRGHTTRDRTLVTMPTLAQTADRYQQGDTADLLTQGVLWVGAGATVKVGDPVFFNPSTGLHTNVATDFRIPNAMFDSAGGNGDLVLIRISAY